MKSSLAGLAPAGAVQNIHPPSIPNEHNEVSLMVDMSQPTMSEPKRWTVKCQDTADGTGDVIVDLPPELLATLGLSLGDELTIEVLEGAIVLKPERNTQHGLPFSSSP